MLRGEAGWAVQDTDYPAEFWEAAVPGADVALGVAVHGLEAGVLEEPDVLFALEIGRGWRRS